MSTHSHSSPLYFTNLGLGYSIAIALAFLVLLSIVLLASYICCRPSSSFSPNPTPVSDGIILPRVVFVAEDEDDENVVVGLDQAVINSYPKFQFTKEAAAVGSTNVNTTCSICLCEYRDLEMLRMMPECRHYFHVSCLDAWLKLNGSCPICRNSPLPTPLSTPLSEIVPLSQHAADRRRMRANFVNGDDWKVEPACLPLPVTESMLTLRNVRWNASGISDARSQQLHFSAKQWLCFSNCILVSNEKLKKKKKNPTIL
uniref:RING-type domain-containing protein n=3 Tax=Gossypium raimondii TaxID=29730 RepID=A0A0D2NA52_GOSRA|nr:hypothetical protein B456_001G157500 [Gossypium raimondii]